MSTYPEGAHVRREAVLSEDGAYRYSLVRRWGNALPAQFVMLNPSTADDTLDDPTIRRCVGFAQRLGCGGIVVVNLYALRSTDPAQLWKADDPVGPRNDTYLSVVMRRAGTVGAPLIAAWGANAKADRVAEVLAMPHAEQFTCLGLTKAGAPRHPLYVRADAPLVPLEA